MIINVTIDTASSNVNKRHLIFLSFSVDSFLMNKPIRIPIV